MHYHQHFGSSGEVLDAFYSCSVEEMCPVGGISQGKPDVGQGGRK